MSNNRIYPSPDRWQQDRPGLSDALVRAARWFDAELPEGWEIYVQPPVNGLRPDLVVMHPQHGAAVFAIDDGVTADDVAADAERLAMLQQRLTMTLAELATAAHLPHGHRSFCLRQLRLRAERFEAPDDLSLAYVLAGLRWPSKAMPAGAADCWRAWLRDDRALPASSRTLGFSLTAQQRDLIANPSGVRARRLRGAAGSGKSIVIAGRAARLAQEGKRVLVLSFNATLPAYLMDLAARQSSDPKGLFLVTVLHFHAWLHRIATLVNDLRGFGEAMSLAMRGNAEPLAEAGRRWVATLKEFQRWDAILVDEAQDFDPSWWDIIRGALRQPGGELLIAVDRTQNLYGMAAWPEPQMEGFGFRGPWLTLATTFRLPPTLCRLASHFMATHLNGPDTLAPEPPQGALEFGIDLAWQQATLADFVPRSVAAVKEHVAHWQRQQRPMQTVCLVGASGLGLRIVQALEAAGMPVEHTFGLGDTREERRADSLRRKRQIRPGKPGVLVTTIHSFKGWEGASIIAAVPGASDPKGLALLYTAMTRLRNDPLGARLTLVSVDPALDPSTAGWPAEHRPAA